MNKENNHTIEIKNGKQYVSFALGNEIFAIDVMFVESLERVTEITPVPKTDHYVLGIINIRGDIVPVIDLRQRLVMGDAQYSEETRIIVTRLSEYRVGILVDGVNDVYTAEHHEIQTSEEIFEDNEELVSAVIKHDNQYILVLDLHEVLELDEQRG